jgi:hypothetical protein
MSVSVFKYYQRLMEYFNLLVAATFNKLTYLKWLLSDDVCDCCAAVVNHVSILP